MMLVEVTSTPGEALPVAAFRQHLRMGTGFGEDSLQDEVLENLLRAAVAAIEGRTGKALFLRSFLWTLTAWRDPCAVVLPVAPAVSVAALKLIGRTGGETVVEPTAYRLVRDTHRPMLQATGLALPTIPTGGSAEVEFSAGFGAAWSGIPADLGHAVLLLAGHYYEHRHDSAGAGLGEIPFGVGALIERYRALRVGRAVGP